MTLNNNLAVIYKKETTAVVEHPMTEDDLTHPGLYRFKRNSLPCYTYHQSTMKEEEAKNASSATKSTCDWDLYPGLIRNIENEGTPEQVEKLHRMEHNKM